MHMLYIQQIASTSFPHQLLYSGGITLWNHLLTFPLCNMIYIDAFSQGLTAAVVAKMSSYAQLSRLKGPDKILVVFIQKYFTPEDF